jgi:hypothetical protein
VVNLIASNANLKPKHTMLPLLTVLFLISYGLMTMLVVEQGRTIDAQRTLIRHKGKRGSEAQFRIGPGKGAAQSANSLVGRD